MNYPMTGGPPSEPDTITRQCPECFQDNDIPYAVSLHFRCERCDSRLELEIEPDGDRVRVIESRLDGYEAHLDEVARAKFRAED